MKIPPGASKRLLLRTARAGILLVALSATGCGRHQLLNPLDPGYVGDGGPVVYVASWGDDSNDGRTAETPQATIEKGIDTARRRGAMGVRIAEGVYDERWIELASGVSMLGGYSSDFSQRDPAVHVTEINESFSPTAEGESGICIISASDATIGNGVVVEGIRFVMDVSGTVGEWDASRVIQLTDGASPTIRGNTFDIRCSLSRASEHSYHVHAIIVGYHFEGTYPYSAVITNNRIVMTIDEVERHPSGIPIALANLGEGSDVRIAGNHITSSGAAGSGIVLQGARGVTLSNNVISLQSSSSFFAAVVYSNARFVFVNNTVVCAGDVGDVLGLYGNDWEIDDPSDVSVVNNIFVNPAWETRVFGFPDPESLGTVYFDYNLWADTWGAAQLPSTVQDGGHNVLVEEDIWDSLFRSDYDADLSDGDDTDYRLYDPEGEFAADLGADTSGEEYGSVLEDILGTPRPAGGTTAYDIGAYEKPVVFVSANGSADNAGTMPDTPKAGIQEGIDAASAAGASEVRIAKGTYVESVTLAPRVSILGGYASDFSERDPSTHTTIIAPATDQTHVIAILAADPAIDGRVRVDGLAVEVVVADGPAPEGTSAITMEDGAWPTVSGNAILIDKGPVSSGGWTTGIWAGFADVVVDFVIRDNAITIVDSNGTGNGSTAIYLVSFGAGSTLMIERNRISATDPSGAEGISIDGLGAVSIRNNVVSVHSSTSDVTALHFLRVNGTAANNTFIVDGSHGLAYRAVYAQGGGESYELDLLNNIFVSRWDGDGVIVQQEDAYDILYDYNLAFYFAGEFAGTVTAGPHNQTVAGDIFEDVFSSPYDGDLTDGDDSDYHLSDSGDLYAVDRGMDLSGTSANAVNDDIDGETRPKGAGYDRGADEAR